MLDDLFNLDEAARYLGLSAQTLKLQAEKGRLAARKRNGEWLVTMANVMAYVATRQRNAGDVAVVCLDCERVFFSPSEAVVVSLGRLDMSVLGCPNCRSPRMGVAALPTKPDQTGQALVAAVARVLDRAKRRGRAVELVDDATGATVELSASSVDDLRLQIDVDRDGEVDSRDAKRLRDIVASVVGRSVPIHGPRLIARYEATLDSAERRSETSNERKEQVKGIRTGAPGTKYIRFTVDVWYQETDNSIHLTSPDEDGFHTTVNDHPGSKRCHPSLYRHLRRMLEAANRWPAERTA
jgi:hypothetical protein